ncbi:MAG: exodeoxyribonuclease VII small subunit [Candidatus Dormibacteraeota bacterium]|nr:exodeoxyribonuclease VII small subunit [Candidatus Dormibacteraeota bacterium]
MSEKPAEDFTYEQALELFDARLRELEEGNLTLEQAIEAVAEGRRYLKICEAKLEAARHKIEVRPGPQAVPATGDDGESDLEAPPRDLLL